MPPVMSLDTLGTIAAFVTLLGYLQYSRAIRAREVDPNATMWVLSSIGGLALLTAEGLHGVPWNGLKLDALDALLAAGIAFFALSRLRFSTWQPADKRLLFWYLLLLAIYLYGDFASREGQIDGLAVLIITAGVIVIYNITTLIEFWPMMRETWKKPEVEAPAAWTIWLVAYVLLMLVRVLEGVDPVNLIHPLICVFVHLVMVILPMGILQRWFAKRPVPSPTMIESLPSPFAIRQKSHRSDDFWRFEQAQPARSLKSKTDAMFRYGRFSRP